MLLFLLPMLLVLLLGYLLSSGIWATETYIAYSLAFRGMNIGHDYLIARMLRTNKATATFTMVASPPNAEG